MSLLVILSAIVIQRYLHFCSKRYPINWVQPYYTWWRPKLEAWSMMQNMGGLLLLILPILLVASFLLTMIHALLGGFGAFVAALVLFWFCLDVREHGVHDEKPSEQTISYRYQHVFAVIFWYFVFGPVGMVLYVTQVQLLNYLSSMNQHESAKLAHLSATVLAIMDWVPVRLTGLSFALVGHFATVFKSWYGQLLMGLRFDYSQLIGWGVQAIDGELSPPDASGTCVVSATDMEHLLDRALLVWLVVIALCSIGYWLG